jgi:hypothetical protein
LQLEIFPTGRFFLLPKTWATPDKGVIKNRKQQILDENYLNIKNLNTQICYLNFLISIFAALCEIKQKIHSKQKR